MDTQPSVSTNPYTYTPSTPAAITATTTFFVLLLTHTFLFFKRRTWFFALMPLGLTLEILALFLRIPTGQEIGASFVAACWAPSILASAIHMTLGRLIWYATPASQLNWRLTGLPPQWLALLFFLADNFALFLQVVGSSGFLVGNAESARTEGTFESTRHRPRSRTLMWGLVGQMGVLVVFAAIAGKFTMTSRRWKRYDEGIVKPNVSLAWQRLLLAVNAGNGLLLLRTLFAVLEANAQLSDDKSGVLAYLNGHEWAFWAFDGVPVFLACAIFIIFHPGTYLTRRVTSIRLHRKQLLEEKKQAENGVIEPPVYQPPVDAKGGTSYAQYEMPSQVPKAY